jgi:hypothetical protein
MFGKLSSLASDDNRRLVACALALLFAMTLGASTSFGADSQGHFEIISGWGAASCGKYLSDIEFEGDYDAWIAGYLTAFNVQTPGVSNILSGTDAMGAIAWVKNYCQ